ncbi:MAG: AAA family ATPase [Deltaproteobacteria bacterium]|nr:AAA family ATPase [Deltaproteobacteria bacterium]
MSSTTSTPSTEGPDDLELLVSTLPAHLQRLVRELQADALLELVLDLGRPAQARFLESSVDLSPDPVTRDDLDHVAEEVGEFGADNRAGIERTLHRISALRNRRGEIVGLTLRVGRAVRGTIDLIRDLVESGRGILLVGRPGVGKTTMLRETARVLADEFDKRVMVVDTSNEIAGDGDVPHPAIGKARRMQVPHPDSQHAVMIEAVENHMPEVVIIDEIGTLAEAVAARTIAERGVQLVGTAHGNTLQNLVTNPTLCDLVGGVQTVTLGDEEARIRGTQKTISERKGPPTFGIVVEIASYDEVVVHRDTGLAVDALLRGEDPEGERRLRTEAGKIHVEEDRAAAARPAAGPERKGPTRIYPYALSRDSLERVIRELDIEARAVGRPEQADMILALKSRTRDARLERLVEETGAKLYWIKRNGTAPMRRVLQSAFHIVRGLEEEEAAEAVEEAEAAAARVLEEGVPVELTPRSAPLRKLQHLVASRHQLPAESIGREPGRRLVIHPG